MSFKFTPLFILVSALLLMLSAPVYSQMCAGKSKPVVEKSKTHTESPPSRKVNIKIPANYRPPLANEKLITFPETVATKKKQKKLLKRRKKAKKKGCIAANM